MIYNIIFKSAHLCLYNFPRNTQKLYNISAPATTEISSMTSPRYCSPIRRTSGTRTPAKAQAPMHVRTPSRSMTPSPRLQTPLARIAMEKAKRVSMSRSPLVVMMMSTTARSSCSPVPKSSVERCGRSSRTNTPLSNLSSEFKSQTGSVCNDIFSKHFIVVV